MGGGGGRFRGTSGLSGLESRPGPTCEKLARAVEGVSVHHLRTSPTRSSGHTETSSANITPRRSSSSSERRPAAESSLARALSSWHTASPSGSKGKKRVSSSICTQPAARLTSIQPRLGGASASGGSDHGGFPQLLPAAAAAAARGPAACSAATLWPWVSDQKRAVSW